MDKKILFFILFFIFFGCGSEKISGDEKVEDTGKNEKQHLKIVEADTAIVCDFYQAVGSIRPKIETRIESQIQAQVLNVSVSPGKRVNKGDILLTLDDRAYRSRLNQSKEALKKAVSMKNQAIQEIAGAEAAFKQAEFDYKRVKKYFESEAATKRELEQSESAYLQASANLKRTRKGLEASKSAIRSARQQVKEAEIGFEFSKVRAPESGEVLKRMVEPGDIAIPGKTLLILQTSGSLMLEAFVREGLISKTETGKRVKIRIDSLDKDFYGIIEEIVPYADPKTRTFLVKAAMPGNFKFYPGMYGKLLIPAEEKEVVVIPEKGVITIGQLKMVNLKTENGWTRVFIKTGTKTEKGVEVFSGLKKGDKIGIN